MAFYKESAFRVTRKCTKSKTSLWALVGPSKAHNISMWPRRTCAYWIETTLVYDCCNVLLYTSNNIRNSPCNAWNKCWGSALGQCFSLFLLHRGMTQFNFKVTARAMGQPQGHVCWPIATRSLYKFLKRNSVRGASRGTLVSNDGFHDPHATILHKWCQTDD